MPDFVNRAAVDDVADQTMAVARHGDEVAMFGFGGLQNLGRWIAEIGSKRVIAEAE